MGYGFERVLGMSIYFTWDRRELVFRGWTVKIVLKMDVISSFSYNLIYIYDYIETSYPPQELAGISDLLDQQNVG